MKTANMKLAETKFSILLLLNYLKDAKKEIEEKGFIPTIDILIEDLEDKLQNEI